MTAPAGVGSGDELGESPRGTVTIALPVYNGARFLAEAIGSATAQTVPATEVLVLDNASTDGSPEIAAAALGVDAVRRSPTNRGAAWNFNRAVDEARGDYFAWLAADDRLDPRFVELTLDALQRQPGASACLTAVRFVDPTGAPSGEQRDPDLASPNARTRLRSFLRRRRWTEVYCLYRRDALLASPRFREAFGADVLLTWWLLLRGPLVVLDEPLVDYRVYPTKTIAEMAESLTPGARHQHWRKLRLWRALWQETAADDVDPKVRRTARQELLGALTGRAWLEHHAADALLVLGDARARLRARIDGSSGSRRATQGWVRRHTREDEG